VPRGSRHVSARASWGSCLPWGYWQSSWGNSAGESWLLLLLRRFLHAWRLDRCGILRTFGRSMYCDIRMREMNTWLHGPETSWDGNNCSTSQVSRPLWNTSVQELGSSVSIVSGYGLDDQATGVRSPAEAASSLASVSRSVLGPTQPTVQWVPRVHSPGQSVTGAWRWPLTPI
jgi:hypothetical protein